jgi:uncharacterized protein YggU (UPF0235/DUF167 family)
VANALFHPIKGGVEFRVRLTPKASSNRIGELASDSDGKIYLKVYVTVVPEEGKANQALIALLAKTWKIPKSAFTMISGHTDRSKVLYITGDEEILGRLKKISPF